MEFTRSRLSSRSFARRLKCSSFGYSRQGLAKQVDLRLEIRFGLEPTVDVSDEGRELLALLIFDVELERLKERVPGIPREEVSTYLERASKRPVGEVSPCVGVPGVDRVVLGADLVVEALIGAGGIRGRGVGGPPIEVEHELHLAQCLADLAVLPRVHCGLIQIGFLTPQPDVLLLVGLDLLEQRVARGSLGRSTRAFCSASRA